MYQYQHHQEWLKKLIQYHLLHVTYFQKLIEEMGGVYSMPTMEPVGTIPSREDVNRATISELMNDERLEAAYFRGWNDYKQMISTRSTLMNNLLVSDVTRMQHFNQLGLYQEKQLLPSFNASGQLQGLVKPSLISLKQQNQHQPYTLIAFKEVSQNKSQEILQDTLQMVLQNTSQEVSQEVPQDTPQDVLQEVQRVSKEVMQKVPQYSQWRQPNPRQYRLSPYNSKLKLSKQHQRMKATVNTVIPAQNYFTDAQTSSSKIIFKDPNGNKAITMSTAIKPTTGSTPVHQEEFMDHCHTMNKSIEPHGYSFNIHKMVVKLLETSIFLRRLRRDGLIF